MVSSRTLRLVNSSGSPQDQQSEKVRHTDIDTDGQAGRQAGRRTKIWLIAKCLRHVNSSGSPKDEERESGTQTETQTDRQAGR